MDSSFSSQYDTRFPSSPTSSYSPLGDEYEGLKKHLSQAVSDAARERASAAPARDLGWEPAFRRSASSESDLDSLGDFSVKGSKASRLNKTLGKVGAGLKKCGGKIAAGALWLLKVPHRLIGAVIGGVLGALAIFALSTVQHALVAAHATFGGKVKWGGFMLEIDKESQHERKRPSAGRKVAAVGAAVLGAAGGAVAGLGYMLYGAKIGGKKGIEVADEMMAKACSYIGKKCTALKEWVMGKKPIPHM